MELISQALMSRFDSPKWAAKVAARESAFSVVHACIPEALIRTTGCLAGGSPVGAQQHFQPIPCAKSKWGAINICTCVCVYLETF